MSPGGPSRMTDQMWRSALTLLAAAVVVYFAYRLFMTLWPFLAIVAGLLLVIRIVFGAVRSRSEW